MARFIGDMNNDGRITMIDVPLCLKAASGQIDDSFIINDVKYKQGDVDGDGSTTLTDVRLMLDHINGVNLIDEVVYGV